MKHTIAILLGTVLFILGFSLGDQWNDVSIWCGEVDSKVFERKPKSYIKAKAYIYGCGAGGPTTSRVAVSYFKSGFFRNSIEYKDIYQSSDGVLADLIWHESELEIIHREHATAGLKTVTVHGYQVTYRDE